MVLRVEYLNHASVLLDDGGVALLSDPWFSGDAFSGGWGLQYHNPDAFAHAQRATHLWISHWHSDHMHPETLQALVQSNPALQVLSNESANFSMSERLRSLGFRALTPLHERRSLRLNATASVLRFPTAGIDNALVLKTPDFTVLNYNDCNLPSAALRALVRDIGPVDLLLTNYNHAGKLFAREPPETIKATFTRNLLRTIEVVTPRVAIPFASSHYYRAPDSVDQNASLIAFEDLERLAEHEPRLCVLRIGDTVSFERGCAHPEVTRRQPALAAASREVQDYGESVREPELIEMARAYAARLRHGFPLLSRLTAPLRVRVRDLDRTLRLDCAQAQCRAIQGPAHIDVHSQALRFLIGRRFGADTFMAGAHFAIDDPDTRVIERWGLLALLDASRMTERDALRYLGTQDGRRFLWCRREEIVATLSSRQVKAGQLRQD